MWRFSNYRGQTNILFPTAISYFGVLRRSAQVEKSHLRMRNMYYSSVETDNNPLICFIRTNRMWKIQSPWELFNSKILFSRAEISVSLNALYKNVNMQLSDFA